MHEAALVRDVVRELQAVARRERAARVTRIRVRVGPLSHFTPEHFREHFADASRGTVAEGAAVDVEVGTDTADPHAQGVLVERVEVELPS